MKPKTFARVLRDQFTAGGLKGRYWAARKTVALTVRLLRPRNRTFAVHVLENHLRFLFGSVRPLAGQTRQRAQAAAEWLLRAQDATPDGGVSYGYFPCDHGHGSGWRPSYPETTGYIIPSLLDFAEYFKDDTVRRRALEMAFWEIQVQMASGAVQSGMLTKPRHRTPAVFNTGMVLHGYSAAYRASGNLRLLEAGRRAATFLLGDLGTDGHFRTHGTSVTQHRIKTYSCLCAWALYRFGEDTGEAQYQAAAIKAVEAAVGQQQPNGWFANNCLTNPVAPLLHTIGYTLQGILEVGILAGRDDLVDRVRRGTDPLLARTSPRGFLHGQFYADWEPASFSSCLTGSAQLAVVCYRLHEITGVERYLSAADRILDFLKALQIVDSPDPGVNGALAGSFPLLGSYLAAGYPNWATKYFLDGLLLQDRLADS